MISAHRHGFTLVEMLVVVAIFGVLVAMLIPALMYAKDAARRTQCLNNQQTLSKAIFQYDLHKRRLPWVASTMQDPDYPNDSTKIIGLNWVTEIFGEMDRIDVYTHWHQGSQKIKKAVEVPQLICPSGEIINPIGGLSYYVNLGYVNTTNFKDDRARLFRFGDETKLSLSDLRSTANLVMLSERTQSGQQAVNGMQWAVHNEDRAAADTVVLPYKESTKSFIESQLPKDDYPLCFRWANRPAAPNDPSLQLLETKPTDTLPAPHLSANHRGSINVTFFDGSTKTIPLQTHCWNDSENPVRGAP
jgi:prepilin-type N-terminal cleavage/methylation domain-containing protein/prepilin-type processing-associated H-X9-DG protein